MLLYVNDFVRFPFNFTRYALFSLEYCAARCLWSFIAQIFAFRIKVKMCVYDATYGFRGVQIFVIVYIYERKLHVYQEWTIIIDLFIYSLK